MKFIIIFRVVVYSISRENESQEFFARFEKTRKVGIAEADEKILPD